MIKMEVVSSSTDFCHLPRSGSNARIRTSCSVSMTLNLQVDSNGGREGESGHGGGAVDTGACEPRRNHGEGRRGAPACCLQGGGGGASRHSDGAGLPHPPPIHRPGRLLPPRHLHGRTLNRTHVIALGAFLWAAATIFVALSNTFLQVAISRALNGIGLALVVPAIQSLVADSTDESTRGIAFGWLQLTGNIGSILGYFFALLLASTSIMGIAGWRIAFHLVAIISVVVGILVRLFAVDPHFPSNAPSGKDVISRKSVWAEVKDLIKEAKAVMRIPSFQVIVAQGIAGSFFGSALSFIPMWLELIGFSHEGTGLLMILFAVATSLGGLFGGKMGDFLARHFPNSGRIVLSQISSGSAIPLAAVLLLVLPDDPSTGLAHAIVLFILGSSISWNAPATNNPIFAEIVPERSRTSIYALDNSFESMLASFAPPVVGILAEHVYGYKAVSDGSGEDTAAETDRDNATSLARALYTAIAIPMSLCCSIYSFL